MALSMGLLGSTAYRSDYELISTVTANGTTGIITFTSLPQSYKHLQIRVVSRATAASYSFGMRFNADTTNGNYSWNRLEGQGSTISNDANGSTNYGPDNIWANGSTDPANAFSATIIDLLDYTSTSKNKTTRVLSGGASHIGLYSGLWKSTASISEIAIIDRWSANFAAGSRFSLYGLRG